MKPSDIKLRRLRAGLAIFEQGSTVQGAAAARMSQPATATALSALEGDLGLALFERSPQGMTATEAGRIFFHRVASAFGELSQAETVLQAHPGRAGGAGRFSRLVSEGQLKVLLAMTEATGFSDAARQLKLSQPSVHRAARDLETLAGVPLWLHEGGGIRPSTAARRLARQANLFHAEIAAGLAELAELQGRKEGELSIGALPLARAGWLPNALGVLLREQPEVRVRIVDSPYQEQLTALLDGRIDMILGAVRDPVPEGVLQEILFEDPLVILVRAGHPLAAGFDSARDKLSDEQLGGLSWVLQLEGTPGREHFEAFMAARGLPRPTRVVQCSSVVAARALLLGSDHAAVLSRGQIELEVNLGLLKVMGPPLTGSWRSIGIATRGSFRPTRLQARLLALLRDGAAGTRAG